MKKIIYSILDNIEIMGYDAYLVGGYVRDYLMCINSFDIDIATNANIQELLKIFDAKFYENYGCIKFKKDNYDISITTYRKELSYENNKPNKILKTNDLYTDALRRDFTINAIYMDKFGNLIDPFKGVLDIEKRTIKLIGKMNRIKEDKTRILRALRFMCVLDFELDNDLKEFIINNKEMIAQINYNKKKMELDKIFSSSYVKKFFDFIERYEMKECFDINYDKIDYNKNNKDVLKHLLYWSQLEYNPLYNFTKEEKRIISDLKIEDKY